MTGSGRWFFTISRVLTKKCFIDRARPLKTSGKYDCVTGLRSGCSATTAFGGSEAFFGKACDMVRSLSGLHRRFFGAAEALGELGRGADDPLLATALHEHSD